MSSPAILEIRGLATVFDGFRAVDGLDLTVAEGEVRFLIGPNGAGKTTLIDTVTGLVRPAAGSVRFAGLELVGLREYQIVRAGVGRTFQTPSVFERLSVVENIDLAATFRRSLPSLLRRRRGVDDAVAEVLELVGLAAHDSRPAGTLSHGQRQWLEIGMLLVQNPRLLLLDEPVAGMTAEERTRTGELLQSIALTRTLVVVEHDMDFVRRFATRVTVLHEGKMLCEGPVAEVQADPVVQEVYLGRAAERRAGQAAHQGQPAQVEVR
ncbi:MAG TPA: urea ABC transporter ATP-binding protein UrtD [Acidimicrobiia bacterium]|nr:urea ABC transporter ATP-binding protein UrtD [Acidimicrobiia bacterium]